MAKPVKKASDKKSKSPKGTRPTLAMVAEKAKVSNATVSRALNGTGRMAEKTRERIKQIAEELGYEHDPSVSSVMSQIRVQRKVGFRGTLAYLYYGFNFERDDNWLDQLTLRRWYGGAEARAAEFGFKLERLFWDEKETGAYHKMRRMLRTRGFSGLIIHCSPNAYERAIKENIPVDEFACATIGSKGNPPIVHYCENDQFMSGRLAFQEMYLLGYQRIGLVTDLFVKKTTCGRFEYGFASARDEYGVPTLPALSISASMKDIFFDWLEEEEPDAIVGSFGYVCDWLQEKGIQVPEEMGFATLEHDDRNPKIAGVDQHNELVGAAAVDLLVSQLNMGQKGLPGFVKGSFIHSEWVAGETVRSQAW